MPRATLKKLGLSENEIQVYLTTLSLKNALVSSIASKCGLKRTSTYAVIDKLVEKGFLSSFTKNGTKYYCAVDPEVLVDKCKQNVSDAQNALRDMEKILPILSNLQLYEDEIKVQLFDGFESVKTLLSELLHHPTDVDALIYAQPFHNEIKQYLLQEYFPARNQFITKNCRTLLLDDEHHKHYKKTILSYDAGEIKHISESALPIKASFQLYENTVCIYTIKQKEIIGIKIENKEIYDTFKALFFFIWNNTR